MTSISQIKILRRDLSAPATLSGSEVTRGAADKPSAESRVGVLGDVMRFERCLLSAAMLLCLSRGAYAQPWSGVLAPARAFDWTHAGVVGGIPDASWTQCGGTIAPYGSSGSPQSAATISNALAACPNNTYVLLGAGTFYLSNGIVIRRSNVALRGSGPT